MTQGTRRIVIINVPWYLRERRWKADNTSYGPEITTMKGMTS
jgi:hypothetical protein